jgi:hypothetical protein
LELTAASGGILSGWRQLGDALPRNLDPRMRRANEVSVDGVNEVDVDGRIVIVALYQIVIVDVRVFFPRFHRSLSPLWA